MGMTGRYNGLYIDLESYQSVVYRVRGDGRAYLANIRTDNWVVGDTAEDIWQAVLLSSGYVFLHEHHTVFSLLGSRR